MDADASNINSLKKKALGRAVKTLNIWTLIPEWDATSGTEPKNIKNRFEDPDISLIDAPLRSIVREISWKTPSDFYKDKILVRDEDVEISSLQFPSENIKHPWLQAYNAALRFVFSNKASAIEESFLWKAIFPKSKENPKRIPTASTARYTVRLFFAGCWRRVIVDDRIPVTDAGDVLFQINSSTPELWTILLAKAILKVETILFGDKIFKNPGDLDTFAVHALTGWFPGFGNPKNMEIVKESTSEGEEKASRPQSAVSNAIVSIGAYVSEEVTNPVPIFHQSDDTSILKVDGKLSQEWNYALLEAAEDTFLLTCLTTYSGEEIAPKTESELQSARLHLEKVESTSQVNEESSPYFEMELFKWDSPPSSIHPVSQLKPAAPSSKSVLLLPSSTLSTRVYRIPAGKHIMRFTARPSHQHLFYLSFHGPKMTAHMEDYVKLLKRLDLSVFEAEGTFKPTETNAWSLLFKYSLTFGEPLVLASYLHISEDITTNLRIINNDTNVEEPNNAPQLMSPNSKGYAILADYVAQTKSQVKWRLILVTDKGKNNKPHFEAVNESVKNIAEQTGVYTPNKYFQLFRKTIKVTEKTKCAIQLSVSIREGITLFLETFNNGELIQEVKGQGTCQISDIVFLPPPKKDKQLYVVQGRIQAQSDINLADEENKLLWKLRLVSAAVLAIKNDTEKEDRQAAIKAAWEAAQPGRAAKAKKAREKYLQTKSQNIMSTVIKLTPDMPPRPLATAYQRIIDAGKITESIKEKEKCVVELEASRKSFAELQSKTSALRKSFAVQKKGNANKIQ